jgi:hypothetical protein
MEKQRLLKMLEQLRAELAQTDRIDVETSGELEKLIDDLERALEQGDEEMAEDVEPVSGLRDMLLKYEVEHPQLSAAIGRVADALAAMGF